MRRVFPLIATTLVAFLFLSSVATAEELGKDREPGDGNEQVAVYEPAFPEAFLRDRLRLWANTFVAPSTDFGEQDLGLTRTEIRLRARVPVGEKASVQVTADFHASLYDEDGNGALFDDCAGCTAPNELYATSLDIQGGYLLNRRWAVFRADELWAVLGSAYVSAHWEPGAFEESVSPGMSAGIGYQMPDVVRIALAARVERALDGDGVKVAPTGYLRWKIAPQLELRNRGLGLQLEYRPNTRWELFLAGFRSSDSFRLDDRPGAPSGTTFGDRQISVGGGIALKAYRAFRLTVEAGAIVDREIEIDSRDGELDSADGDPSPYFLLRLELRP